MRGFSFLATSLADERVRYQIASRSIVPSGILCIYDPRIFQANGIPARMQIENLYIIEFYRWLDVLEIDAKS
jgi:hypothetical protein